jgi:NADPH:quinone reductase-like Zn-dependent oxidoreductase
VLVRVHAPSLNQGDLDYLDANHSSLAWAPGCGHRVIVAWGLTEQAKSRWLASTSPDSSLETVFGKLTQFGHSAFTEYAIALERAWAQKPSSMSYEEAATLPPKDGDCARAGRGRGHMSVKRFGIWRQQPRRLEPHAAILALQGLRGRGGIAPGDRVLVNGASGSVGSFGLQIAKAFGTTSPAFAAQKDGDCARAGRGRGHRLHLEDYTQGGQRYDRIIDVAGNRSIFKCRPALKPRGTSCSECSTSRICACQFLGSLISLAERKKMGFLWWNPSKKKTCRSSRGLHRGWEH